MGAPIRIRDKISFATVGNIKDLKLTYNKEADSLLLQPDPPIPAISVDWNGEMWLRINPENGVIVGVEIEDYKKFFAKKYRDFISGIRVTDPTIKKFIMFLLREGMRAKPFTKETFIRDLEKVSQPIQRD